MYKEFISFPSLEAKMTKLKLFYSGHIMRRQVSLEKTEMLGKIQGSRKWGRPNVRWIDSLKEAIGLEDLSRVWKTGRGLCSHPSIRSPGIRVNWMACNTHKNISCDWILCDLKLVIDEYTTNCNFSTSLILSKLVPF